MFHCDVYHIGLCLWFINPPLEILVDAYEYTLQRGVDIEGILIGWKVKRREIISTLARAKRLVTYACEQLMYFLISFSLSLSLSPLPFSLCIYLSTGEAGTRSHDPTCGVYAYIHGRENLGK